MGFSALRADTQTWTPGSALWDLNAANWNGGAVWSNGNDALFESSGTAFQSLTLGTGVLAGNLTFGTSGYAISGGSLTLTGGVIETQPGVFATVEASLEGGVGLTKTGAGTLFLSGVNTYTGGTVVSAGSLRIVDDENLGAASGGLTLSGGVLQSAFVSLDRTVAVNGTGGIQVDRNGASQVAGVISGSGVLSKLGDGELRLSGVNTFGGSVVVEGGTVRLRPSQNGGLFNYAPSLASATGYTIRARGTLFADASALTTIAAPDFLSDTAGITLDGGRLSYWGSNAAGNFLETVGDLNLTGRHSSLLVTRTHASSSVVLALGALSQSVSDATVNFQSTNGTLGSAGNNPRITFRTAPSLNDGLIGGWALANTTDFATYTGSGSASDLGVSAATYYTGAIGSAAATDNVRVTAGNGTVATLGDLTINSLVFAATASTPAILQTAGTTLTLDTGGLLFSGAFNSTFGSSGAFLTSNSGALYLHKNDGGSASINSTITGNISLIKTQGGAFTLGSGANSTYSGGTFVNGGLLVTGATANRTYLGTGPVTVNSAGLTLGQVGATTSTAGYTINAGGQLGLNLNNVNWAGGTAGSERFTFAADSVLWGSSAAANQGLNSLTRVSSLTGTGHVVFAPNAVMAYGLAFTTVFDPATLAVKNLGTNADLYFGLGIAGTSGTLDIGQGTAFKGLSTDRSVRTWATGTLRVASGTSAIDLQGLTYPDSTGSNSTLVALTLGNALTAGGFTINPLGTGPLTAFIRMGQVTLDDDSSVFGSASAPLTFRVSPGAVLELARDTALGTGTGVASVIVETGGTLQQNSTNVTASAINGNVRIQGGGRFLAQRAGGITGSGTLTFDPGSILQISNATGWSGSQALAATVSDQAIVRLGINGFGTAAEPLLTTYFNGRGVYEILGNFSAAGPTAAGTSILNLNGGLITNDLTDRAWGATTNGTIFLTGSGTIAASTGSLLTMSEDLNLAGNTLLIGSSKSYGGNAKLGEVSLAGAVVANTGAQIQVVPGARLRIGAANVLSDNLSVALSPGSALNVDFADTILRVDGTGAVTGDSILTLADPGDFSLVTPINGLAGFGLVLLCLLKSLRAGEISLHLSAS
jgi:autotransporter-associated beta strand protein